MIEDASFQSFLAAVVGTALAAGLILNRFYTWTSTDVPAPSEGAAGFLLTAAKALGFLLFLYLAYKSLRRTGVRRGFRELRENPKYAKLPILILTAVREDASRRRYELETGLALDVQDYVEKPIPPVDLLHRVSKLLGKAT